MSSSDYCSIHTKPYIVIHYQYYKMVDLLIQYCRRLIDRLNPCALPYVPVQYHEEVKMNRKPDKKACNSNLEGWKTQIRKKGKRKNNNKNIPLKKLIVV